jgi:TolB protein
VSRPFVSLLLLAAACKGAHKKPTPPPDAAPSVAVDAAPTPTVDLSFVRGAIYAAAERDAHIVPLRLDPATAAWVPQGGKTSSDLFPTAFALRGGVLVIATEGASASDHTEQLAILRGDAVELFGPRAGAVRNPSASADGSLVVVETSENNFRDLYKIDAAGAASRLTDNREGNFEPSLSPDASSVVFSSSRDGDSEIYRAPVRGGAATRLTAFHKDDWSPLWSPDNTNIVFLSDREGPPRLFLMSPDGTSQRRATPETDIDIAEDLPRWSPDGKSLLFSRGGGTDLTLSVLDLPSGKTRSLTPSGFSDSDAAWSPDGQSLVAIRRDIRVVRSMPAGDIVILKATDGSVIAPLGSASGVRYVRWLP